MQNYNRVYKIIIGNPTYIKNIPAKPLTIPAGVSKSGKLETIDKFNVQTVPQDAVEITELQFTANIVKSGTGKGAGDEQSTFKIYGCHPDTITKAQNEHAVIHLYADYTGVGGDVPEDLPLIYAGQVTSANVKHDGTEVILEITAKHVIHSLKRKVSLNYAEGSKVKDVITDIADKVPNTVVGITALEYLGDKRINNGLSLYGNIGDNIDKILKDYEGTWSIENGEVIITPKKITKNSQDYQILYANKYILTNDLIKEISYVNDNSGKTQVSSGRSRGVRLKTFIIPLKISNPIEISEGDYKGTYRIKSINYSLDFRGNAWDVIIETESY